MDTKLFPLNCLISRSFGYKSAAPTSSITAVTAKLPIGNPLPTTEGAALGVESEDPEEFVGVPSPKSAVRASSGTGLIVMVPLLQVELSCVVLAPETKLTAAHWNSTVSRERIIYDR